MTWLAEWRAQNVAVSEDVPARYRAADLERVKPALRRCAEEYMRNFYALADQGRAPLFLGQSGTGKSMASAYVAMRVAERACVSVSWVNCSTWNLHLRTEARDALAVWIRELYEVPFLVLDDVHSVVGQYGPLATLAGVLSERWDRCFPTLVNGNLDLPQGEEWDVLSQKFGPAVARRMQEGGEGYTVLL